MKKILLLTVFILLGAAAAAQSQDRLSVTLSGGFSTGAYELSEAGIGNAKAAFRVNVGYSILPILDAYVGYNRNAFTCSGEGFCNEAPVDFTGSGFNVGLRLNNWPKEKAWVPWLRAGLVYQTLEVAQTGGNESFNYKTDAAIGFEVGTGFTFPVTPNIAIIPSFNYMRYTVSGANNENSKVVTLSGLAGVQYSF